MKRKRFKFNIEIPIVILIAGLILVLMRFADNKLNELIISDTEVLFMEENYDPNDLIHEEFANRIADFRPDVSKMIEMYTDDFELLVRVQFDDNEVGFEDSIKSYPELTELLATNSDGFTIMNIDDSIEYIYFKWSESVNGDRFLFIVYTNKPVVKDFWIFHALCYTILVLVGILLMKLSLSSHRTRIEYYQSLSEYE